MAKIEHVKDKDFSARGVQRREWRGLVNGDYTSTWDIADFPDRVVQFSGTVGSDLSVTAYGSSLDSDKGNDPTTGGWYILKDANGNDLTKTSLNKGENVQQNPRYIACKVTNGTNNSIDITIEASNRRGS